MYDTCIFLKFKTRPFNYDGDQNIAQVRVNGSYIWKIEKVMIKGFAPVPFISLSSGA